MRRVVFISALATIGYGQAMAGAPSALLTIQQLDANGATTRTWTENLIQVGLINSNAQTGNFAMTPGSAGQTISDGVDYWAWQASDSAWHWHVPRRRAA